MADVFVYNEEDHEYFVNDEKYGNTTDILKIIAKPALIQWAADLAAVEALSKDGPNLCMGLKEDYEKVQTITDSKEKAKAKKLLDKQYPSYHESRTAHMKKKDKAANWGTLVHKAIERWIDTKVIPTSVEISGKNHLILPEHLAAINNFVAWATKEQAEFLHSEKKIYSKEWRLGGTVDFVCRIKGELYVGDLKTSSNIYEEYFLQTSCYAKMMIELGMYPYFDKMVIVNCRKDGTVDVEVRKDIEGNIKCFEAARVLHNRLN